MSGQYNVIVEQPADEPPAGQSAAAPPQGLPPHAPATVVTLPAPPSPAAGGPQLRRREIEVDVPGYEGFKVRLWVNYPQYLEQDMAGLTFRARPAVEDGATMEDLNAWQDEREQFMRAALSKVVLWHNGWVDFDGAAIPQPQDLSFWEKIPTELATAVIALQKQAAEELPNSIARRRRGR